jgi:hypothetical protein
VQLGGTSNLLAVLIESWYSMDALYNYLKRPDEIKI